MSGPRRSPSAKARALRNLRGQKVNLRLEDGSVIINVQLLAIHSEAGELTLRYRTPSGKHEIELREILRAEPLNLSLS
jgi:hypothetical protein